jgi:hypothetical protein
MTGGRTNIEQKHKLLEYLMEEARIRKLKFVNESKLADSMKPASADDGFSRAKF